ncbi:nucleomorphin-like [Physella acuta]|uniref:nucleomorphin-like n=1 Tax=Physella acuta TaxID=109671 RepID=UPI0027DCE0A5|nr:nucleomorphin-like [Physella acuta]
MLLKFAEVQTDFQFSLKENQQLEQKNQAMQLEWKTTIEIANTYSVPEENVGANDEHMYLPFVQGQQSESDAAKIDSGELNHVNNMAQLKNLMEKITWTDSETCDTTLTLDGQKNEKSFLLAETNTYFSSASPQQRDTGQVVRTEDNDYITSIQPEYVDVSYPASTSDSDENLPSIPLSTNNRYDDGNGNVENIAIRSPIPVLCNLSLRCAYIDFDGFQVHIDDFNDLRRYSNSEKLQHTEQDDEYITPIDNDNEYITPIDIDMDCLPLTQDEKEDEDEEEKEQEEDEEKDEEDADDDDDNEDDED